MNDHKFLSVAATESHPHWQELTAREGELYHRENDVRSEFARDYTRILHSMAYRRLKHKTQVFCNIDNDHICTRMEHVAHVESVSSTLAKSLGLNEELTKAIAMGHDLGHAPFGHLGEQILNDLSREYLHRSFWHEQNGLRFVDHVELLKDSFNNRRNLHLTYAVRDGIIAHCGEVNYGQLRPREERMPLEEFDAPNKYQPATWEGCVVKISDKIAYLGRDIEDAVSLGILGEKAQRELLKIPRIHTQGVVNTTTIIYSMILDICQNSSPEAGICLSADMQQQLDEVKDFNYKYIYRSPRLKPFTSYARLVLTELFQILLEQYDGAHTWQKLEENRRYYPVFMESFSSYLMKYCHQDILTEAQFEQVKMYENEKIYGHLETEELYVQAILDYISGMTDRFAVTAFEELITY